MKLRTMLGRAVLPLVVASLLSGAAFAQGYPGKAVRVIIPFPPGGPTDIVGRMVADTLSKSFSVQYIADNRAGAGGNIGFDLCAKSPADGYTLCIMTVAQSISPSIYQKLPFDPVRDFAPVTLMALLPSMLTTHPSLPVKNVKELVALAKSKPGQLVYASTGNGTSPHMLMEMFKWMTGTSMVHVPYKGQAPAIIDQIAGQVQLAFNTAIGVVPHVNAGKLKPLAISTKDRFPTMPELPTVAESGVKGFDGSSWNGVVMPAGVPRDIVMKTNEALAKSLKTPETRERLLALGAMPSGNTPEEFAAFIKTEKEKWAKVAKAANIKLD
ncbi:MAG: tripartite tricarboxylate transporter substrate binding protein [Hydrogenophaga sp.]|uniref:Bug family tripartite tricarboxylate transporter substrate binding protein n=1 Tax=Hydrogenophaga sp. TaxID=1904254 RepID=UPI0027316366|nr:tripartite tricarboxylate transporter substrate binding protein [Hydrogenophaga sp.]MDP2164706.1 tripartite tricarboxylate transporter substrate binding protein [Hydrogenophaga sp.]